MTDTRAPAEAPLRLPAGQAIGVVVLAFAAAIGVGHLVAGVVSPLSSPFQAVADAVVRLAPSPLVEFGKSLALPGLPAGRADKVGLLVGVGVVLLGVAVAAGLASRASARPARWALVVLGLVGLAAVFSSPVFALADLVAPLAAMGAGLWSLRWLHERAMADALTGVSESATHPDKIPDSRAVGTAGVTRRGVLVGVGAVGAGVGGYLLGAGADVSGGAGGELVARLRGASRAGAVPVGADFAGLGTPTFLTANADFYRIDTALRLPVTSAADWSMRVHGMVERELVLSYADLLRRPLVERPVTLACVSNEVGGDLISTANFVGVELRPLLLEAGVRPGADQLLSTSQDGWTAGTPTDVLLEPDRGALLALGMNGEPLPLEHGFPVRMVVPGLYGYVSATKWLADLELTTFEDAQAYWLRRGWAKLAPIKTQSRIDRPRSGDSVPAGPLTVAGIAWAQHRGVSGVEVRVDGGPWQPAVLSTEVGRDTWRMWRADLTLPPGPHRIQSRATDATGVPQTEAIASPVPDGATGYPEISVSAR
ncbi:molybdopterin-dependent oxidoreductase [Pseudonocardia acaciae]|uniref:molybdopterin-dependent oxidoreductase n=1 Tax=Pseudonocardia acaciae TaxID=551276 RepID=UPI00048E3C48|nr:molybdopterin-dependent oxidoreductase [Pseudonocardia acaciae]